MLATFSLHSVVTDVGAWCGLAALIGLALLVLLYFAQARELRRISDWIENEEQRRRTAPGPVARATVIAQGAPPLPPQAPATGTVTTAVPGVRRVAVPPTSAAGPPPGAVLAPATAAAVAAASQAPEQANGDGPATADAAGPQTAQARVVAIPVAAPELPAEPFADEAPAAAPAAPQAAGEWQAPAPARDPEAAAPPLADAPPPRPGLEDDGEPAAPAAAAAVTEPRPAGAPELAELGDADVAAPATPPPAAVPLVARRIPTAEPEPALVEPARGIAGGVESRGGAASPLDLLRAEPPAVAEAEAADEEAPPLQPSTAAGARTRFPPAPPVRVQPPRGDDVTIRVPGRGAPSGDRTERRRGRGRDPREDDPREDDPREDGPREDDPRADDAGPPRTMASTLRLLGAAVVIVAILIVVATQLLGGSSAPTTPPSTHTTTTTTTTTTPAASATGGVVPGNITVAVLNGTTTAHLASAAMSRLTAKGFVKGAIANAPSQSDATTTVGYRHGHRRAALAVAADLGLGAAAVGRVDSATYAQARRNGATPEVVVTLGADYAAR